MLITITDLLDADHRGLINGLMPALEWENGTKTAGRTASQVKQNLQANLDSPVGRKIERTLKTAISSNPVLRAAAQPKLFSRLLLSQTNDGGGYGTHIDNAFITADGEKLRTDLSFTLFLSDPTTYVGGELEIEQAGQTHSLKPNIGDLVLYPSTRLHRVNPVRGGTRLACVGWIESHVKNIEDREVLFDLINLQAELSDRFEPQSVELLTLSKVVANLRRRLSS